MRSTQRFSYRKGGADSACRRRKHAGGKRSARLLRVERLEERMVLSAGVVLTSIGPYSSASASFLDNDRIVVAGESSYDFAVLRYQADGTLDPSFGGTDGIVTTSFKYHAGARAVAPTPDGQIVVGGYASGRNVSVDYDFAVARYNDEGTLDSSFGTSGTVQTSIDHSDHLTDVVVLDDGSIIAAGASKTGVYHATLVGYTPTGRLDNNFGDRGIVQTVLGDQGDGIVDATIHHGKILAAANASFSDDPDASFALVRYNLDGTLDDTFGDGGKVISHFQGIHASAAAVAVNTDQSIVVVGGVVDPETDHFYFAAAHYDSGGNLDTSFGTDGTGGLAVTEFGEDSYPGVAVSSVAIQEDGKIVVAGTVHPGSGQSTFFGVVRYNNDGTLDTGCGQDLDNDGPPDG